jgi:hypothetical protein
LRGAIAWLRRVVLDEDVVVAGKLLATGGLPIGDRSVESGSRNDCVSCHSVDSAAKFSSAPPGVIEVSWMRGMLPCWISSSNASSIITAAARAGG